MTIHYHGTPITPRSVLETLKGCHFCISFAAPNDVEYCHEIGQSILLDNGAFSMWRKGKPTNWPKYYEWVNKWLSFPTTVAIIPDVIDGGPEIQDELIRQWPHGAKGIPVWHMDESIERLLMLCDSWAKVCFGSTLLYGSPLTAAWELRCDEAFNEIGKRHKRLPWIHMLRGMATVGKRWPFASVDSTDVARNHNGHKLHPRGIAERWDAIQCPGEWPERKPMDLSWIFQKKEPIND